MKPQNAGTAGIQKPVTRCTHAEPLRSLSTPKTRCPGNDASVEAAEARAMTEAEARISSARNTLKNGPEICTVRFHTAATTQYATKRPCPLSPCRNDGIAGPETAASGAGASMREKA